LFDGLCKRHLVHLPVVQAAGTVSASFLPSWIHIYSRQSQLAPSLQQEANTGKAEQPIAHTESRGLSGTVVPQGIQASSGTTTQHRVKLHSPAIGKLKCGVGVLYNTGGGALILLRQSRTMPRIQLCYLYITILLLQKRLIVLI
jgi:hypothetical protein